MGTTYMTFWQIAAGDGNRYYDDVFLKYGVILVGPGSDGEYFQNKEAYNSPESEAFRPFIAEFAQGLDQGDLMILKKPRGSAWEILAVGEVASEYLHQEVFGDVDGWDLQHCRKVNWKKPAAPAIISGLTRGTLKRVHHQTAIDAAKNIWATGIPLTSDAIPPEPLEMSDEELIDSLMIKGLPGNHAESISKTIWRLKRIAKWYSSHGADVGEHEIRAFLIIPLLTTLGWAEQRIKIEWNNIDVTIFDSPYHKSSKPIIILESKRLWDGLMFAPAQAMHYAQNYPDCKYLIVSDGIRYKLFDRNEDDWRYLAYMNLLTMKHNHPYYQDVKGAVDFFLALIPRVGI
jgi:hypothetical protein